MVNEGKIARLQSACERGDLRTVAELCDKQARADALDVNVRFGFRITPLHFACCRGHLTVVQWLVDHGADLEAETQWGGTPLIWACDGGHVDVVRFLIARGADLHTPDNEERTPFYHACVWGRVEVARLLVQCGAATDSARRRTAFSRVCSEARCEMALFLAALE